MSWHTASASVIGSAHEKSGAPCQDAGSACVRDALVIGALADGAGSASRSEIGSQLTVETALQALKLAKVGTEAPSLEQAAGWFDTLHQAVIARLTAAASEQNCALADLACTLIAFVASPDWICALQIGDGLLITRADGGDHELLFKPDRGEYVNETLFITSQNAREQRQICVRQQQTRFICAASDGIERVAIKYQDWSPHAPFFKPLEEYMQTAPKPDQREKDLIEFLRREKMAAKSDDDRTLVLCAYKVGTTT
jgi:hypothetical protein